MRTTSSLASHEDVVRMCEQPQPKVIRDSNPDFRINPYSDRSKNVVDSLSYRSQSFRPVLWKSAGDCIVWEMLINLLQFSIPQWRWKWKSDPESVSGTGSPKKTLISLPIHRPSGPSIIPSFNQLITFAAILHTDRLKTQWQNGCDRMAAKLSDLIA